MRSIAPGRLSPLAVRAGLLLGALASTGVWLFTVVDDYLYHTPYFWGQWCGASGLPAAGRGACSFVYNYYYSLDAHPVDSGVVASAFLLLSLGCVAALWTPALGPRRALIRTFLVLAPAILVVFEVGVYFLLNYWWTVHATEFLSGTPLTNEAVFVISAVLLSVGVTAELLGSRGDAAKLVNNKTPSRPES